MPRTSVSWWVLALLVCGLPASAVAQVVPGTGTKLDVGDDFEADDWEYYPQLPKASSNIDHQDRQPAGYSKNNRWYESTYRGTPDFVKRVATPPGGIPGSKGALALQTLNSGVPNRYSNTFQQDDFMTNVTTVGSLQVQRTPSIVVRVYLPPFEEWEKRTGSSFGFRADCQTTINKPTSRGRFFRTAGNAKEIESYWPGMFIQFNSKADRPGTEDSAMILIRSGSRGEDVSGPMITKPGWWTLGMSFTPDGQVHYYASEGVDNLTPQDRLLSSLPYGYRTEQVNTFFYNIVNQDDGRTWSTRWIIDDPSIYVLR